MLRFCQLVILVQLLLTKTYAQQEEPLILDDSVSFDAELAIDDDIFGNVFDEDTSSTTSSWFEDFTVRVSQQFFGQVNNHSVEPLPGFVFPREAETENNRLGINIRYQNAFSPGWLLQASGQIRSYWKDDYEYEANGDRIDLDYRVNELFLQRSFDQHSIKFGRQTVV